MAQNEMSSPTKERPLLVGLLVDVSGSMTTAINNTSGESLNRLQSFEKSLEEFAAKAKSISGEKGGGLVKVFAYGFGFGNPLDAIAAMFGKAGGPKVRDLLAKADEPSSTISLDYLAQNWSAYQSHVQLMALQMFGDTPMGSGFQTVKQRFRVERQTHEYNGRPVLFVLSDGEPTDVSPSEIVEHASELKQEGVLIISCYVTNRDIAEPRHLYGTSHPDWPEGARLMFECASALPTGSPFESYMREYGWVIERGAHLFTQINQSEILTEFLSVILSPLENSTNLPLVQPQKPSRNKVFISYSHADSEWLERLRVHLRPLERKGVVDIWDDTRIQTGGLWRKEIEKALNTAKVALLLVSANFLASDFIHDNELPPLLKAAEEEGAIIIPIILSPSLFSQTESLSQFQSVNPPSQPLTSLSRNEQEKILVKVAIAVESAISPPALQNRAAINNLAPNTSTATGSQAETITIQARKRPWWKFW